MAKGEASLLLRIKTAGEEALASIKSNIAAIGTVATSVFAAMSAVVVKSIAEFKEQEEATNKLNQTMVNSGVYTKQLAKDYQDQAAAVEELTLFKGEEITLAQNALQAQLGEVAVSKELTMAVADLATAKKMDLASAAELVAKSIGTGTNALARQRIEISATASKQEKMVQVIGQLNRKFGGQAAAATQGLGSIQKLSNMMDNAYQVIGEKLAPVISIVVTELQKLLGNTESGTAAMGAFATVVTTVIQAGVVVGKVFMGIGEIIGAQLGSKVAAVSELMKGNFVNAAKLMAEGNSVSLQIIKDKWAETTDLVSRLGSAQTEAQAAEIKKQEQMEIDAKENKKIRAAESHAEDLVTETERAGEVHALQMAMIGADEQAKTAAMLAFHEKQLQMATTHQAKMAQAAAVAHLREQQLEQAANAQKVKDREETGRVIATLASSNNQTLASIGKAAAITQIAIDTPVAVGRAYAAFPPPANFIAAGLVATAMAAQAAKIAGIPLAEGGVVLPRPGGTQATIGEAGQAEAVIPLDKMGSMGGVTINVYGGLLGDQSSAREFAVAVDRQLLELRRNNESVAFDSGVV